MERERVEITTPIKGHKVSLNAWLTGRERRAIRSVFVEGVTFQTSNEEEKKDDLVPTYDLDGSVLEKAQNKTIEAVVHSIDDSTEDILNRVLDMHEKDMEFIIVEINKLTSDLTEEDKKK